MPIICDTCGKEIDNKKDLIVYGRQHGMIFLKKAHKHCYYSKSKRSNWMGVRIPVNNTTTKTILSALFIFSIMYAILSEFHIYIKSLIVFMSLIFPAYLLYIYLKFEKQTK